MDTNELYLTFKLLKRRYRSSEDSDELRRLDYFNHPFEEGSEIRLIDDIDLPKSVSLRSLATQFVPTDNTNNGKQNAMKREVKEKGSGKGNLDDFDEFEPFNPTNSHNF